VGTDQRDSNPLRAALHEAAPIERDSRRNGAAGGSSAEDRIRLATGRTARADRSSRASRESCSRTLARRHHRSNHRLPSHGHASRTDVCRRIEGVLESGRREGTLVQRQRLRAACEAHTSNRIRIGNLEAVKLIRIRGAHADHLQTEVNHALENRRWVPAWDLDSCWSVDSLFSVNFADPWFMVLVLPLLLLVLLCLDAAVENERGGVQLCLLWSGGLLVLVVGIASLGKVKSCVGCFSFALFCLSDLGFVLVTQRGFALICLILL
jgi:hypothetical protein